MLLEPVAKMLRLKTHCHCSHHHSPTHSSQLQCQVHHHWWQHCCHGSKHKQIMMQPAAASVQESPHQEVTSKRSDFRENNCHHGANMAANSQFLHPHKSWLLPMQQLVYPPQIYLFLSHHTSPSVTCLSCLRPS